MSQPADPPDPLPDEPPPASSPAEALEHIVDDYQARQSAEDWAKSELLRGRNADDLLAELIAQGWAPDTAEEIVEDMRRYTRPLRGIVTRDAVVADADQRFRRSFAAMSFLGLGVAVYALVNLLHSLFDFRQLWRQSRGRATPGPIGGEESPAPGPTVRLLLIWPRLLLWILLAVSCYLYIRKRW